MGNLVASRTSVKREGAKSEDQGRGQTGHPDVEELGEPVSFRRHARAVPAHEIDLRGQIGAGQAQSSGSGQKSNPAAHAGRSIASSVVGARIPLTSTLRCASVAPTFLEQYG